MLHFLRSQNYTCNQFKGSTSSIHIKVYLQSFLSIIYRFCYLFPIICKRIFLCVWSITLNYWFMFKVNIRKRGGIWLLYMICVTHCFSFFSVIATLEVAFCIFKLNYFNVPIPWQPFLSLNWVIKLRFKLGHSLTNGSCT